MVMNYFGDNDIILSESEDFYWRQLLNLIRVRHNCVTRGREKSIILFKVENI